MEPKRKRGRPPKVQKTVFLPLESQLNEQACTDLQIGYKILKEIINIPKSKLILDKPDENLFGLHDYYEVIKQPLWLSEISRKFDDKEYSELKEVVADFRIILENCYRFWGANHKFSKHTFRIEKVLEKHLKELPRNIRPGCDLVAITNDDESNESESALLEEYQSKILQHLTKKQKEEESNDRGDISEEELLKWESEVLIINSQAKKQIKYNAELADIGFFLKLTHQVLCVKHVTQCEIERMLLMSKESSTLATLMTAFLCPTAMRGSLYLKPLMTYEVWTTILCRKLDGWFSAYLKCQNKFQIFLKYGIELFFWEVIGDTNPLHTTEFHLLPLNKKAWILKTLCTSSFHSNKNIEKYFSNIEDYRLRSNVIYEDTKYVYYNEFSPEIRVYRIEKLDGDHEGVKELMLYNSCINNITQEDINELIPPKLTKKQKFCLIANDRESLEVLKSTFNRKKKSVITVEKLLTTEKNRLFLLKGLTSMYYQWKKCTERSPKVLEISTNYWINKVPSTSPITNNEIETPETAPNNEESSLIIFGKRLLKNKLSSFKEVHSSSSNEDKRSEESISDWEDGNIRRSRRIRRSKCFPRQWERRYANSLYETSTSRPILVGSNKSLNNTITSKVSGEDLSNPNDYVSFMNYQQQKINAYYNTKKNGLTIKKTLVNSARRSIVSAAVENAANTYEIIEEIKIEPAIKSNILTISIGNNNPQSVTPYTISLNSSEPNETCSLTNFSGDNGLKCDRDSTNTSVSEIYSETSTSQPAVISPVKAVLNGNNSFGGEYDQSSSLTAKTFSSEWLMTEKSHGNDKLTTTLPTTPTKILTVDAVSSSTS